ncbi:DUF5753 domain-containing protein [Saccharopolyspora sp. NPDC000359]|uniref:DUF5753 domain-containing protein n=1 Tax=Saccharopolyspora sp. NPDC000359 TaxID=3154251 RepID=UPI00331B991C
MQFQLKLRFRRKLRQGSGSQAIILGAGATRGEAEQRVNYRLGRRDVLTRSRNPVKFCAIIGEHALRHPPCDDTVMLDQLRQLEKWAELANVSIQVLPVNRTYSPALEGPFVLIEFDRTKPVVQLEHYRSSTTITDARDVGDYQAAADVLRCAAMDTDASAAFIAEIADRMEQEQ